MTSFDVTHAGNRTQAMQLDKLVRGQTRLELAVEDLRRNVERLPEALKPLLLPLPPLPPQQPPVMGSQLTRRGTDEASVPSAQDDAPVAVFDLSPVRSIKSFSGGSQAGAGRGQGTKPEWPEDGAHVERGLSLNGESSPASHVPTTAKSSIYDGVEVHPIFQECVDEMVRTRYSAVQDLSAMLWCGNDSSGIASALDVSSGWGASAWRPFHESGSFLLHPASRTCAVLDMLRTLFLAVDAVFVPYSLAYDADLEGWLMYLAWTSLTFWTLDVLFNFVTGYIDLHGGVVMERGKIVINYLRTYFVLDLAVLVLEGFDLATYVLPQIFPERKTLRSVKGLRFLKVTRLIRIIAKLRAGFYARILTHFTYWIRMHGWIDYEHHITFASIIIWLMFVIAWFGHIGSCLWHAAGRSDGNQTSWHQDWMDDRRIYMHGLYWALATMFSGSSPLDPVTEVENGLAVTWLVMGAIFVTSVTSKLAATLIESSQKQWEVHRKNRQLAAFMGQRHTPALLAFAVQVNFTEKIMSAQRLTELDLPCLELLDGRFRADLRDCHYGPAFLRHDFFRMLNILDDGLVKALCWRASWCEVLRDGEEMFGPQQEMPDASLLHAGSMWYTYSPSGRHKARTAMKATVSDTKSMRASATQRSFALALDHQDWHRSQRETSQPPRNTLRAKSTRSKAYTPTQSEVSRRGDEVRVEGEAWACELAVLLKWTTVGILEAQGTCELLRISAQGFMRLVTSNMVLTAVASSYAAAALRALPRSMEEKPFTDIDPRIKCDEVVCGLEPSVKGGLISMPILLALRSQQKRFVYGIGGKRRKSFTDLHNEVKDGKCHLTISAVDHCVYRVVRLVLLDLRNRDDKVCVSIATRSMEGFVKGKFQLPGRKVEGTAQPDDEIVKLIAEQMGPLAPAINLTDQVTYEEDVTDSASFHMSTKYIKTIYSAVLDGRMVPGSRPTTRSGDSDDSQPEFQQVPASWWTHVARSDSVMRAPADVLITATQSLRSRRPLQLHSSSLVDKARSMIFPSNPYSAEGLDHSFAILLDDHGVADQGLPVELSSCHIYKWLDHDDFQRLSQRRADVEKDLRQYPIARQHVRHLASWTVRLDLPLAATGSEAGGGNVSQDENEDALSYFLAGNPANESTWVLFV